MIPAELEPTILNLPPAEVCTIVIITGPELRHDRFALRLQSEFPRLVVAWLQVAQTPPNSPQEKNGVSGIRKVYVKARSWASSGAQLLTSKAGLRRPIVCIRELASDILGRLRGKPTLNTNAQRCAEHRLFGEEIERLKTVAYVVPKVVPDPNAPETIQFIRSLNPYFILTLGGAIYHKELRDCARGLALNQHDGWCPEYRGSETISWSLYHRDLSKVASTIHVLTDGMDSGPILRRSTVCMAEDDTIESSFARSVALGSELMCETVRELISTKRARLFPQPQYAGRTYLARHMNDSMRQDIRMDLERDLIARDIARRVAF